MRLRFVAELGPAVSTLTAAYTGDDVSFLPLSKIWPDGQLDVSEIVAFDGDVGSYNPVAEGDLLVPKVSPTFAHGRAAIAVGLHGGRALATSEVFVLRAADADGARFLSFRLRSPDFLREGKAAWTGVAGLKRVSAEFVRNTWIDDATWSRRAEVADFLAKQVEQIARVRETLARSASGLQEAERAIADEVVAGLPELPLKAVATIHSGVTLNEGKALQDPIVVPYLRVANVKAGWLDLDEVKDVAIPRADLDRLSLRNGDLLLTEGGDVDKLGRGAIWQNEVERCVFQNHVFAVRPSPDRALPEFLSWSTRSSGARAYFERTASRITNIASTNRAKLGRWPVPTADLPEQSARVDRAEKAWAEARRSFDADVTLDAGLVAYRDALIYEAVTGKRDLTQRSDAELDERLQAAAAGRLDEVEVR